MIGPGQGTQLVVAEEADDRHLAQRLLDIGRIDSGNAVQSAAAGTAMK